MLSNAATQINDQVFLSSGGEIGQLIRSVDWSATPLGPVDLWPVSLKLAVRMILTTPFPMYIAWGKEYTQLYNDGYRPILGSTKHPQAMGLGSRETFAEIWHIIGTMFDGVMDGKPVGFPDFMLPLDRNGYIEECYFDFSYSPISDEYGNVGGVLVTVIETTGKVNASRELEKAKLQLEQAQAEAVNQRDRLKRFFMQAPAGVCILNGPDLVFELVNPAYQKLLPERELIGKPIFEALPELADQPVGKILTDTYTSGETFEAQELLIPIAKVANGPLEDRYFNFVYQPRLNEEFIVDGLMVFVYEVTEIVLAKKEFEKEQDKAKMAANAAELGTFDMDLKKGTMFWDKRCRTFFGISHDDEVTYEKDFVDGLHPDDRERVTSYIDKVFIKSVYNGNYDVEYRTIGSDDQKIRWVRAKGKVYFDESNNPVRFIGSVIDITEQVVSSQLLKESEENFRLLADNISQLAWMTDETGYIFWYNKRWYDYTGTTLEEMKGWGWQKIHDPDYVEEVTQKFKHNIQIGEVWEDTFPIKSKEGEYRWFLSRAIPSKDKNGKIVRWFGTNTDITDQRKLVQQKEDFISIASHELKTPLTSLKGYIQISKNKTIAHNDVFIAEALTKAEQQVNKMNAMIKGFLDMSRFESGKFYLELESFNLVDLLNEVIEEARLIINTHNIVLQHHEKVTLKADRNKIGQIINNFITNAIKYSPRETTIEVTCEPLTDEVRVGVKDRGIGINPQHIDKLFDRFYRVNNGSTSNVAGFGVGLYICAEIIKLHNGKIWVESEPGIGSTFYFSLPINQ